MTQNKEVSGSNPGEFKTKLSKIALSTAAQAGKVIAIMLLLREGCKAWIPCARNITKCTRKKVTDYCATSNQTLYRIRLDSDYKRLAGCNKDLVRSQDLKNGNCI